MQASLKDNANLPVHELYPGQSRLGKTRRHRIPVKTREEHCLLPQQPQPSRMIGRNVPETWPPQAPHEFQQKFDRHVAIGRDEGGRLRGWRSLGRHW
jgi:hypothetical protein